MISARDGSDPLSESHSTEMSSVEKQSVWVGWILAAPRCWPWSTTRKFTPLGRKRRRTKGTEGADSVTNRMMRTVREALVEAKVELPSRSPGSGLEFLGRSIRRRESYSKPST